MSQEHFDLLMANTCPQGGSEDEEDSSVESQEDSEVELCESDPADKNYPPTTLRLLYDRDSNGSNADFVECCQLTGVISKKASCPYCLVPMILIQSVDFPDGIVWSCPSCYTPRSVTYGSWFQDYHQVPLKYLLPILYCWCKKSGMYLCQSEMGIMMDKCLASDIYRKCKSLASDFFQNEICSIGSKDEVIEIEEFLTSDGLHIIGGVEKNNSRNVFFRVLPSNWTRDDLITAICDNVQSGSTLYIQNKNLLDILEDIGLEYLLEVWGIRVETLKDPDKPLVLSISTVFKKLFENKKCTEGDIFELLFRRRMKAFKDPFLYLLAVIAWLHPPPNS